MGNVECVQEQHQSALDNFRESISIRERYLEQEDASPYSDDHNSFIVEPRHCSEEVLTQYEKLLESYEEVSTQIGAHYPPVIQNTRIIFLSFVFGLDLRFLSGASFDKTSSRKQSR